ncbi:MAG: hypothetical protein ACP5EN_06615, partial [Rhodovulum sp.]
QPAPRCPGGYSIDGCTESHVLDFIRQDCRGPLGPLKLLGKPRKKGDHLVQGSKIACPGGLAERYPSSMAAITADDGQAGATLPRCSPWTHPGAW